MSQYEVSSKFKDSRLDTYLHDMNKNFSRSSWQKIIKMGSITVDDRVISDSNFRLKTHQVIKYKEIIPGQKVSLDIPIIYEDNDLMVLDKPAGVLTHSKGQLNLELTVADFIKDRVEDDKSNRAGIVHRLDRDTSGVLIVAKTLDSKSFLQKQFSTRNVKKTYSAIVEGIIKDKKVRLEWPIGRNPKKPSTFRVDANGKNAVSIVEFIKNFSHYSLVSIELLTGRTHQIRVHLRNYGHPIVGDKIYGQISEYGMMLHATSLEITMPDRTRKTFKAALPERFKHLINSFEEM